MRSSPHSPRHPLTPWRAFVTGVIAIGGGISLLISFPSARWHGIALVAIGSALLLLATNAFLPAHQRAWIRMTWGGALVTAILALVITLLALR